MIGAMMTARKILRAVEPDETARKPTTIEQAAEDDNELAQLQLMRRAIARKLDDPDCQGRDMASLSIRVMQLGKEIAVLKARQAEEASSGTVGDAPFEAAAI